MQSTFLYLCLRLFQQPSNINLLIWYESFTSLGKLPNQLKLISSNKFFLFFYLNLLVMVTVFLPLLQRLKRQQMELIKITK